MNNALKGAINFNSVRLPPNPHTHIHSCIKTALQNYQPLALSCILSYSILAKTQDMYDTNYRHITLSYTGYNYIHAIYHVYRYMYVQCMYIIYDITHSIHWIRIRVDTAQFLVFIHRLVSHIHILAFILPAVQLPH